MTHPPPDPEGRRQQDGTSLEATAERLCDLAHTVAPREERLAGILLELRVLRVRAHRAACLSLAARLDAALAVKDEREAVERAWALVRELRGE